MNKSDEYKYYIDSICVYNIGDDEVIQSLRALLDGKEGENLPKLYSTFFKKLSTTF